MELLNLSQLKETKEYQVINKAAEVWNAFLELDEIENNDKRVVNENIHRIQDMMYTRLFIKQNGKI